MIDAVGLFDFRQRKADKLTARGHQSIRDAEYERALEIAAELERMRHSAAFELAALAHAGLGDVEAAVRVLERGVQLAPTAWLNWQLLGNHRSDLERYDLAAEAYERALLCPNVDLDSVRLNQAVLASRREQPAEALMLLDQVRNPKLALPVARSRVNALADLGRYDEAVERGQAALCAAPDGGGEEHGYLILALGRARLRRGDAAGDVVKSALTALEAYAPCSSEVFILIREADAHEASNAKYHRLTIQAKLPPAAAKELGAVGYFMVCDVVADSLDEALQYVARVESAFAGAELCVDEHVILSERHTLKGMYKRSGRALYEKED